MTPLVKICGLTNKGDALHAVSSGADAVGLVFYAGSPRCVSQEVAREICAVLPPFVTRVGLFVNATRELICETVAYCGLDVVQLHGDETPAHTDYAPLRTIKALRIKDSISLNGYENYRTSTLLLDAWVLDAYGGTGESFNWELAAVVSAERPIILAGGLTPENVSTAILQVKPYAVDVSSGVEQSPGVKDPVKVADFIRAAKGNRK
jgi:phosphoribosylanthranilate isomerase